MYRVIAIVSGGLALAACSSTPDWVNLDALKPAPVMDTVRFESEPPGAEAKTSNGQTCRTPCALALPTNATIAVTFTLNGYQPDSENIEPVSNSNGYAGIASQPGAGRVDARRRRLPKPMRAPAAKKKVAAKPAAKPKANPSPRPRRRRLRPDGGRAAAAASARALADDAAAQAVKPRQYSDDCPRRSQRLIAHAPSAGRYGHYRPHFLYPEDANRRVGTDYGCEERHVHCLISIAPAPVRAR